MSQGNGITTRSMTRKCSKKVATELEEESYMSTSSKTKPNSSRSSKSSSTKSARIKMAVAQARLDAQKEIQNLELQQAKQRAEMEQMQLKFQLNKEQEQLSLKLKIEEEKRIAQQALQEARLRADLNEATAEAAMYEIENVAQAQEGTSQWFVEIGSCQIKTETGTAIFRNCCYEMGVDVIL